MLTSRFMPRKTRDKHRGPDKPLGADAAVLTRRKQKSWGRSFELRWLLEVLESHLTRPPASRRLVRQQTLN